MCMISNLEEQIKNCSACKLKGLGYSLTRHKETDNKIRILFVGEAPGKEEELTKTPFVGSSGKLLDEWISYLKIKNYVITNVIKHRPPNNNLYNNILLDANSIIQTCGDLFLVNEIKEYNPSAIITLGRSSFNYLTNFTYFWEKMASIMRQTYEKDVAIYTFNVMGARYKIFPMYHPAYIRRNTTIEVVNILGAIRDLIEQL